MGTSFVIHGGKPLQGEVIMSGSKNAAFPIIAACLLTDEPCVLENVPTIQDVVVMLQMTEKLGVSIDWDRAAHRLSLHAKHLESHSPDETLSRKFRGSILFAGALLGRLGAASIPYPGGDAIGARPLTAHLRAFEELGVKITEDRLIEMDGGKLVGAAFPMQEPSATGTENAILAAVLAPGKTIISLGDFAPPVQELIKFLRSMGADIAIQDVVRIEINGVKKLHGTTYRINPDEVEISSLAALAAATRSEVALQGVAPQYLDAVFLQLKAMGVAFEHSADTLTIRKPVAGYKSFRIQSGLYPKLMPDHLPPFAALATQAEGVSLVHEWMYENRLRYITELQKMGATCEILDPHRALITGPAVLAGCHVESFDLRAGMVLVIAALVARGKSVIANVEHIDRGYEALESRLQAIGADIKRISENNK
ncbi:MAG: UDP-N-acetylglucosamine 1-carboxyvinyltransferase [Candidatus Sungbacteria bacterium]|nr:UDP-N-acetylglucosamine 1-carboxyvinyltransferase [Candidatus Sungbacteria bacterium]